LWLVVSIWLGRKKGLVWVNRDSRGMYSDVFKMVASAGAIAASLVSAVMSSSVQRSPLTLLWAKLGVVCLIVSIIFSVITVMVLARAYDLARSRLRDDLKLLEEHPDYKDRLKNADYEQGRLSLYELALMLTTAYISLVAFLEGFICLGRIVFVA